jgi:hypothetical protein
MSHRCKISYPPQPPEAYIKILIQCTCGEAGAVWPIQRQPLSANIPRAYALALEHIHKATMKETAA